MPYNNAKIEEAVLALLGVFAFENGRAWKRFDFDVMDALHEKRYISHLKGRHESVRLTEMGTDFAKRIAGEFFGPTDHHDPN